MIRTSIIGLLVFAAAVSATDKSPPLVRKSQPTSLAASHVLTFAPYERIELVTDVEVPAGFEVLYYWDLDASDGIETSVYGGGKILAVWAKPGTYRAEFEADLINWDKRERKRVREKFSIVVEGEVPPGPVDPKPPGPVVSTDKFRALIVEEVDERSRLPVKQGTALNSTRVREYMKSRHEDSFRQWDRNVDLGFESTVWIELFESATSHADFATPWILISNGEASTSQPLPATEDALLELLQKYGGS